MATAPAGSAPRRLRRTRAVMALLFTAATAICLTLLSALALQIDASSRAGQLDADVAQRAGGLARAVYFDRGELHLEPLGEDELSVGAAVVAVYRIGDAGAAPETAFRSGSKHAGPDAELRAELIDAVVEEQGPTLSRAPAREGSELAWAAAPVWNDDEIGAVVVVAQDSSAEDAAHARLTLGLTLGCLALLVVAGLAGFALAGRAMRPAAEALARQEQFLTEAAHELRTPLTTLRLLVESSDPGGTARALASVDRLDHLITGLLARARVDAGSFEPERIPLRLDQLVQQVAEEFGESERVRVVVEPSVVTGDPVLLGQAVRNLVENALRYAPGSPVKVTVGPGLVSVQDNGPGLSPETWTGALEPGVGAGLGTGTGLAIVSWVADLHGGRVALADAPGGGLIVDLHLPPTP